jgi:hypothetical protein
MQKVVSYLGKHARVNANVDNLKQIMAHNIEMILEGGEGVDKLERDATRSNEMASSKKNTKKVKRRMLWQNAKHGLVLGTAITAGVAVVVVLFSPQ